MRYVRLKNNKGLSVLLPIAIMAVLIVFGLCLAFLVSFETKSQLKSKKSALALYLADAGIEKTIYEFNQSTGPYTFAGLETFLPDSS
ncbi:MAG: hypothetical protein V1653_00870, partial [bacterium]